MFESGEALHIKFGVDLREIIDHIRDLLGRFGNRALKDTCTRVGADIERKLGPSDRLIGAILCCKEQGVTPAFISIGAAAALHCLLKERGLEGTEENALAALENTSGLYKDSIQAKLILKMYFKIAQGIDPEMLIQEALLLGIKQGVI
jgi:mannitol-1-phosphate 5-dehydrogenase